MNCPTCGKEFEPRQYQKYCCKACRLKAYRVNKTRAELAHINFVLEWAAWKRDFALGKTASNLEVTT